MTDEVSILAYNFQVREGFHWNGPVAAHSLRDAERVLILPTAIVVVSVAAI